MLKIIVIGCPAARKSTFARKLKVATGLPLYYLDMLWHKSDGTKISKEEFDKKLADIFKSNKWIIDGNYQRTLEQRLKECDTVFLLDFSVEECIEGAKSRIGKKREDLPWIEEKFDEEFKQYIMNFPKKNLPQIYKLLEKYQSNKNIVILKTREEANNYLKEMKRGNI